MIDWTWLNAGRVHLVWVAVAFVGLLAWLEIRHRGDLARFVSPVMQRRLARQATAERRIARLAFIGIALIAGVLALMRPQSRDTAKDVIGSRVVADIVVALDVSKSMLAEDAAPNRLERAKSEISAMLQQLQGHRMGLVPFAGKAAVACPLTPDYGFFRMILRGVDTTSVSRGGTRLGEAIRTSLDAFDSDGGAVSRVILLITDGDDQDSYPLEAAEEAAAAGVRIVTIGLGSTEGSQVVLTDPDTGVRDVMTHADGQPVVARINEKLLEEIARTTDGAYVPARVAALDLKSIVDEHLEPMIEEVAVSTSRVIPRELYPWFALASIVALILASLLGIVPEVEA